MIAVGLIGLTAGSFAAVAVAFAINMVVSAVISKAFFNPQQGADGAGGAGSQPDVGNRQQVPPATDNKLPVVYGEAYVGGTIVDLSITQNSQWLFYVMALCEVTGPADDPDQITFGDIYWGGKKVIFREDGYVVDSLYDESTGGYDTTVSGKIAFYLYDNGSFSPTNTTLTAIEVMQSSGLIYTWDSSKKMSNTAFAIIYLSYSPKANITGIAQTRFQVFNSRTKPGECLYDYMTDQRYGAALPVNQIDTDSLAALDVYSDEIITYTPYDGGTQTIPRFRFDGVIQTDRAVLDNMQNMADCADCLIKYNEITAKWGVIVQSPDYDVAMHIDDSNIISAITINPTDIAASYNIIECKFPDNSNQDAFNTATFDLAQIAPELLFPNEPINKQSVSLPLVNNDVRAQLIAIRMLKAAREDLNIQCAISYVGLQLEAGDILTITNVNYGWEDKPYRIIKVTQKFDDTGAVICDLSLSEYNAQIFDDESITQFTPAPNTGIGSPLIWGLIDPPTFGTSYPLSPDPYFTVYVKTPVSGIVQYAEVWYSAFQYPTEDQLIFIGTSQVQSSGTPWPAVFTLPAIDLALASGDWYFFTRMVNSLGASRYSLASTKLTWRPKTFQYENRYLVVAYADSSSGASISSSPRNKSYYGLFNSTTPNYSSNPDDYTWYLASDNFSTDNYLLYCNRSNRRFTLAVGNAGFLNLNGSFVPTETSIYDQTIWSGLQDGTNYIDLDERSGQLTKVGTTSISSADGLVSVTNNTNGTMIVSLEKFLNFGNGVYTKTVAPSQLTIDVFGRVVGFTQQDDFFFTETVFSATAGQTVFTVTHIVGQILVFRNGILLSTSEYSETSSNVTLTNACAVGEKIVTLSMRVTSYADFYAPLNISIASSTSTTVTYLDLPFQEIKAGDVLSFSNVGSPSTFTVASINTTTKVITFTGTISGATAGNTIYQFRATGASYAPYSRFEADLSAVSSYSPSDYQINSGYEQVYVNGSQFNEVDYDLSANTLGGFPSALTGKLNIILFAANNLGVPCSNITNTVAYTTSGATTYPFSSNPLAMELYANGAMLVKGATYDYTATATNFILTQPYDNNFTLLNQQTFARIGAA